MVKLVYGCLAFSLIAGTIIFVSAVEQGRSFRGMTKTMGDAIGQGATVLDADGSGAVTQTGNGRVTGYDRNGNSMWSSKVNRFEEGPSNPYGAGANNATAWCTNACPSTIVEFEGEFTAFGGGSPALAERLGKVGAKPDDILGFASPAPTVFIRKLIEGFDQPRLVAIEAEKPDAVLKVINASEIQPTQALEHVVVGSATGNVGSLTRIVKSGGLWRVAGVSIDEANLKNVCVSNDEAWIGAVGTRVSRFSSNADRRRPLGPPITTGTCTVDDKGVTAVYTTVADPSKLQAARYAANGRRVWVHDLGAQRLLSPAGSPFVVAQAPDGTVTALDAVSGRTILTQRIASEPFVGINGAIVTANREGKPEWLHHGAPPARYGLQ